MLNEYDYNEDLMKECVPIISVPLLVPPVAPSSLDTSQQDGLFVDLQRLIEEERLKEEQRVQVLKQKQHLIGEQVNRRLADKDRKVRELEEEQKKRVYAECTFKPKTTKKGNNRSF